MKLTELISYRARLNNLFEKGSALANDPEIQAHWAKYLCVLASGFLEVSVQAIYTEVARKQSSPHVLNFVERQLDRFQNPKMEKIYLLTRTFSPKWEAKLRSDCDGERKDAVDSIVSNRNNIAHGRNVTITYARMSGYYEKLLEVVELIAKQCGIGI